MSAYRKAATLDAPEFERCLAQYRGTFLDVLPCQRIKDHVGDHRSENHRDKTRTSWQRELQKEIINER